MIRYFVVNPDLNECKVEEVQDTYWFTTPIKKEGFKHKCMVEIMQISHWKSRNLSYSDTCYMEIFTFGDKKDIVKNGWIFKPSEIKANYAQTTRFCGMELWFKCISPDGKDIDWYYNDSRSASPNSVIKAYFKEINRISQYPTGEVAESHTYYDPYIHVFR